MAYEFKFPWEPPWEDLAMEVTTPNGVKCYIFDTFCKEPPTPEEKAARDQRIYNIYAESARMKFLREQKEAREKRSAEHPEAGKA